MYCLPCDQGSRDLKDGQPPQHLDLCTASRPTSTSQLGKPGSILGAAKVTQPIWRIKTKNFHPSISDSTIHHFFTLSYLYLYYAIILACFMFQPSPWTNCTPSNKLYPSNGSSQMSLPAWLPLTMFSFSLNEELSSYKNENNLEMVRLYFQSTNYYLFLHWNCTYTWK